MTTGLGGAAAPQQARPDRDGDPAAAIALPDGSPAAVAAGLPPGNLVVLGGPGSGKTTLLEATMYDLAAAPTGAALFVTSSRQAAVASTARLLARVERAAGGALCCVTWHAFARATAQRRPAWHLAADFLASYLGHLALADLVDQTGMVVQAGDLLEDHPD